MFRSRSSSGSVALALFVVILIATTPDCSWALYEEDAGLFDFVMSTAGHGITRYVHADDDNYLLITSDSPQDAGVIIGTEDDDDYDQTETTSCYVSGRDLLTGDLKWRRNVCAIRVGTDGRQQQHVVTTTSQSNDDKDDYFYTMDHSGIVRAWTKDKGALVWDALDTTTIANTATTTTTFAQPRLWAIRSVVASTRNKEAALTLRDATSGRVLSTLMADKVLSHANVKGGSGTKPMWLHLMMANDNDTNVIQALVGWVKKEKNGRLTSKGTQMALVELHLDDDQVTIGSATSLKHSDATFLVSTLKVQRIAENDDWHIMALSPNQLQVIQFSLLLVSNSAAAGAASNNNDTTVVAQGVDMAQWHAVWTSIKTLLPTSQPGMMGVIGSDRRYPTPRDFMALYRFDPDQQYWDQWYGRLDDEETQFDAVVYCPAMELVVALERGKKEKDENSGLIVLAYKVDASTLEESKSEEKKKERRNRGERHRQLSPLHPVEVTGDSSMSISDPVTKFTILSCQQDTMITLINTVSGTTLKVTFAQKSDSGAITSTIEWMTEEGLATISSALLLDASHSSSVADALSEEEEMEALSRLQFTSRLQTQWKALVSFLSKGSGGTAAAAATTTSAQDNRDHVFGFVKVAVLLSESTHRLWGVDTSGVNRGKITWTVALPPTADWHRLVHGTASSTTAVHGINGGTHSREVLVLSGLKKKKKVDWKCIDGTTGVIHASGSVQSPSTTTVLQVVPLFASPSHHSSSGGSVGCRQMALLLHDDSSVSVVPDDNDGIAAAHLDSMSRNGLYSHVLDRDKSSIKSLQIVSDASNTTLTTRVVGQTTFPGERIVGVAYPQRDEVVQTPVTVLGDDSLLLKYLNPHLAVVITMADKVANDDDDEFSAALLGSSGEGNSGTQRKPLGATPPGEDGTPAGASETAKSSEDAPNLFVNVIDTVSGSVLYRASHANAASSTDQVPALIMENWIVYAFFNDKTRRTELGVLSLYEGMIDKKGITAFSSPEQAMSFSSMDARVSKPVVLAKTYGIAKPVTALGVTSTRGGISSRHVLVATGDDKIMGVDRRMLEPRRPTGDLKDAEKAEGLHRYSPLIPLVSLWSPSYNQTVRSVRSIVSTSTELESQSLILAFGGPDLFFTRLAPSKGFDLLPDSFNRPLLSVVVFGLLFALAVVRKMSSQKMVKMGWS